MSKHRQNYKPSRPVDGFRLTARFLSAFGFLMSAGVLTAGLAVLSGAESFAACVLGVFFALVSAMMFKET